MKARSAYLLILLLMPAWLPASAPNAGSAAIVRAESDAARAVEPALISGARVSPARLVIGDAALTADPHFDWFEYEGRDPVFERLDADSNQYLNPILAGFYPDPSIARAGDDYYIVTSSFSYYPGIPIFHSTDLVNWTQIGHVLDRPSQLDLDGLSISRGVFAPTIRYNDGTFYIICTLVDAGGNFLVTADNPAGPWSDPVWLPFDGIDPSIFFDDDGRVYITNNGPPEDKPLYEGHRAIWIQEFDPEMQTLIGSRKVVVNGGVDITQEPIWIEAPHIFKKEGTYFLIAAEGGTGYNHSEVVFRSDSPTGPYEPYADNPILTQRHLPGDRPFPITSAGHADFVELPNGDWWAVFLATRPYEGDLYNTGRETFMLPVEWTDDGWPVIEDGTEPIPYLLERPALPRSRPAEVPTTGNFTIRDEFDDGVLPPYWNVIRTPREPFYEVRDGALILTARDAGLYELEQPSFVGRRQQHLHASASTAMRYLPGEPGDKAGLAAFQNSGHYFLMSVTLDGSQPVVQLERTAGGDIDLIASIPLELPPDGSIYLKIEAHAGDYDFSYGLQPGEWTSLLDGADGTILSTAEAGGFVGSFFGLYAYSERP